MGWFPMLKYEIASTEGYEDARSVIEELMSDVQEMINDGWQPLGAANAVIVPSQDELLPKIVFFQTIVREDKEEESHA